MSLKWKEIELITKELRARLEDSTVQKIVQIRDLAQGECFVLHGFGSGGPWKLFLCLATDYSVLAPAADAWELESMPEPSTLVMVMRKHLIGQRLVRLEQVPRERFLLCHFEDGKTLLLELLPKRANLILGEDWDPLTRTLKVLQSFRQISLETGAIYTLPPPPKEASAETVREIFLEGPSVSSAVAKHYWNLLQNKGFERLKKLWRQAWKSHAKKIASAVNNAEKDWEEAQDAERVQKMGKALVAKLYELGPQKFPKEKKQWIDGVEIQLDQSKTYSENAEHLFRKSKKMARATSELEGRVLGLRAKEKAAQETAQKIEAAENEEQLGDLEKFFLKEGLSIPKVSTSEEKRESSAAKEFLEVKSSEGFLIFVGRNQEENRRVTFQEARGNDLWMHVKGIPGAHVVIKAQRNKTFPLETLLEAAQLCLYHSKIRAGKRMEVDYTQRKHVRAIKGTVADVTYTGNKTLYLEADASKFKKILT